MMRSFEEIRELVVHLQTNRTAIINHMLEVKRHYESDWALPLPDVKGEPDVPLLVPSLITDTVDGLALRATTVQPVVYAPAVKPHIVTSVNKATTRRKIINATYHDQGWLLKRRRYYRHLTAYGTAAIFIEPDFRKGLPAIRVRDPLETYPEPRSIESTEPPRYVAFITRYSGDELRSRFPVLREEQGGPIAAVGVEETWDFFEWVDHEVTVFGLLGPTLYAGEHINERYIEMFGSPSMQVGPMVPNRAGVCLAVVPQEVSLHSIGTRLNALLGNATMQARLMAMEIVAQQKAIFPDMYALGAPNEIPSINGGQWQDGRTGDINLLRGIQAVGTVNQQPDVRTQAMIDRLERNFSVSAGRNPQMQGESYGSLRTGRALDTMAASSIDPRIQELHEITEVWQPKINAAILECYKGFWPDKKYTMFSGWPSDKGMVEFVPERDIEVSHNIVNYTIPGADVVQLTQVLGSMLGSKTISTDTFQRQHPWIGDAEAEQSRIAEEDIERALIEGIQQQIVSGQMPAVIVARLHKKVREGQSLPEAMIEIDEEIRAEQAAAQERAMAEQEAQGVDPNMVPGLAAGPAAAAPGAMPPEMAAMMAQQGGAAPPQSPEDQMRAMLQGAMAGGA
jgi:hypothetical protein